MKVHRTIQQVTEGPARKEGIQESFTQDIKLGPTNKKQDIYLGPSVGQTICSASGFFKSLRDITSKRFSQVNCFTRLRIKFSSASFITSSPIKYLPQLKSC